MELECVESLAPDTLPLTTPLFHHQYYDLDAFCKSQPTTNYYEVAHASSPLTRPPSPAPKRRRHSYSPPPRPPPAVPHPLTILTARDAAHAVARPDHLRDTKVSAEMREEIVAWWSDMTTVLQLSDAIVSLSANLFDRFLMKRAVSKLLLYPLTAACFLLACKVIMDDQVPIVDIVSRSQVPLESIYSMESVVLNVLEWRVSVVTAHEVVAELNGMHPPKSSVEQMQVLQQSLLLHAVLDYRLAWLRATSVGVACVLVSACVSTGGDGAWRDPKSDALYKVAEECGVDLREVDFCIPYLRATMSQLFDDIEEVSSETGE